MSVEKKGLFGSGSLIGGFLGVSISANVLLFAILAHKNDLISSYSDLVDKYQKYITEMLNQDFESIDNGYGSRIQS